MDIFEADSGSDAEEEVENQLQEIERQGMGKTKATLEEQNKTSTTAPQTYATNIIPKEKVDKMADMAAEMAETVVRMADAVTKVKQENGVDKVDLLDSKKKVQRRMSDEESEEDDGKLDHMAKMAEEMAHMNRKMSVAAAKIEEADNLQTQQKDENSFRYFPDYKNEEVSEEYPDEPENNLSNVDKMLLDVRKAFEDSMGEFETDNTMKMMADSFNKKRIGDDVPPEELVNNTELAESIAELAKVLRREKEARDNLSKFKDDTGSRAVANALQINPTYADDLSVEAIETDASSSTAGELEGNFQKNDWGIGKEECLVLDPAIAAGEVESEAISGESADRGDEETVGVWGTSLEGTGVGMAGAAASGAWALGREAGAERSRERRRVVSLPSEAPESANPLGSPSLGRKYSITMPPPSETGNLVMTYVILLVLLIALWILYSGLM